MLVPENVEVNSETLSDFGSGSFTEYAYKLMGRAPFDTVDCVKLFIARVPIHYALACSRAGYNADETVRL
jgi:hypothetical protein